MILPHGKGNHYYNSRPSARGIFDGGKACRRGRNYNSRPSARGIYLLHSGLQYRRRYNSRPSTMGISQMRLTKTRRPRTTSRRWKSTRKRCRLSTTSRLRTKILYSSALVVKFLVDSTKLYANAPPVIGLGSICFYLEASTAFTKRFA